MSRAPQGPHLTMGLIDTAESYAGVMGKLIGEGKIRGWGQSQAAEDEVRRAHAVTPITAIQSEYSMMERMFEKDVLPACRELGIGFVPFSPLGAGFLSGQYTSRDTYTGDDVCRVITRFSKENMDANQPLLDLLHRFAAEKNATPGLSAWQRHWENRMPQSRWTLSPPLQSCRSSAAWMA